MSQFRQKTLKTAAVSALLIAGPSAVTANAAINNPGLKTPVARTIATTVPLTKLDFVQNSPVLDWRNPAYTLKFDISDTDWTSALKLILSVDPVGPVSGDAPIYVQFNTDKPVKLNTRSSGFDARVELDPAKVRPRGNTLRVYYDSPIGSDCLKSEHGAWVINLEASQLIQRSHAKSQNLRVSDIETHLSNPLTAPTSVGIISRGPGATALQSLLAQGIGLRMDMPPKFTTVKGYGQLEFIAGRRDQIALYVKSETVLNTHGPRLIVDEGRPMTVILTGDTDAEVLNLVKQFATHHLPNTRRTITSTGEIVMQSKLADAHIVVSGSTKLAKLGSTAFDPSWNPTDQILTFDVEDPVGSQGEIVLRLASPESVLNKDGSLVLDLNGHALGQTKLNKTRKSVAFKVPAGILRGQDNSLRMSPDLNIEPTGQCAAQAYTDNGIYLGEGSKLTLTQSHETPLTDLSRLAATGAPFSDVEGKETLIVLPRNNADYNVAVGLLAALAKASGQSWTDASFTRDAEAIDTLADNRNILFLLPSMELPSAVKTTAPRTFQSALRGQTFEGDNLLNAEIDRYASADEMDAYRSLAAKTASRNRVNRGGAAAIYRSPYGTDKLVGVITNVPGESFKDAVIALQQPEHWNAIEGSVARWSKTTVLMAELSSDIPGFVRAKRDKPVLDIPEFELPGLEFVQYRLADFEWPKMASLEAPNINWGSFKFWERDNIAGETLPTMPAPELRTVSVNSRESFLDTVLSGKQLIERSTAITFNAETLQLRGLSVVPNTPTNKQDLFGNIELKSKATSALKWTNLKWDDLKTNISNFKIEDKISSLQRDVRPLGQSWRAKLRSVSVPGQSMAKWGLNQMSAAALLLILTFSLVVVFLGFSSPENRTGRHH